MERSPAAVTGDTAAAESVIMRWDYAAPGTDEGRMLFDAGGDRSEANRFLRAVDELRRSLRIDSTAIGSPRRFPPSSPSPWPSSSAMQVAMARLEDEFRHLLTNRVLELDIELMVVDVSALSLSMTSNISIDFDEEPPPSPFPMDSPFSAGRRSANSRSLAGLSIREVDLFPQDVIEDLRAIATRMAASGYGRECAQTYASVRKPAVDSSLRRLGVEKLSIGDVQRLEWPSLEAKIRRWIGAARAAIRCVFASERRFCDLVFGDDVSMSADIPFAETVKGAALQLFGFAEAISIGRRSPEKLFKILDLHDAIADLLPDVAEVFGSGPAETIHIQACEILSRLADAARGVLSEFENSVLRDPSKAVPGGTIHPLTRYVMNYMNLISDYKATLTELIVSRPSLGSRIADDSSVPFPELELPKELEDQPPISAHLVWIITVLENNLDVKAALYKDAALSHLFIMNNVHYIVHKLRDSADLWALIGDESLRRLTGKFRLAAMNYQRAAWMKILHCLRDEGLHVSGGFSLGVSKSTLRDRFKSFNAALEDAHRVQSEWVVPDVQLREELRISIGEKLLPAYRSFLGRFRQHIETGKHPELYIKYSEDDLENVVSELFEGVARSPHSRRRSYG